MVWATGEYKVGDRVVHVKFGSRIVSNVDGKKLTVAFDTGRSVSRTIS